MPAVAPVSQLLIQHMVAVSIGFLADRCPIVVAPTTNDGVQDGDQALLRRPFIMPHDFPQTLGMELHFLGARFDEGLETKRTPLAVGSRVVFPYRELPNREPQEIKPCFALHGFQGVTDARLARFQLQS